MIDIESIKSWYYLNNRPTRQDVRDGLVALPEGITLPLVEALLPILKKEGSQIINPKTIGKEKSVVITSDWHVPFMDKDCLKVFINFLKEYQPDELVLNGNINDCTSFSTHPRMRDLADVIRSARRDELSHWLSIASLVRDALPSSKISYIGSQCHEGWIDKWVNLSPILVEDENYTIPKWFRLEEFGIDYYPETYDIVGDSTFLITHGTIARGKGGASAQAEIEMSGTNVAIGHTHRLSQVYKTNAVETIVGFETGCFCQRTPWYFLKGRRRMMDWQQGFVLMNFDDNSFGGNCIPIIRDGNDNPYFWVGKERFR